MAISLSIRSERSATSKKTADHTTSKRGRPTLRLQREADCATWKRGRPRDFEERTADQATSKRGWPWIEEDCVLWGMFSLSGEMKSECIWIYIVRKINVAINPFRVAGFDRNHIEKMNWYWEKTCSKGHAKPNRVNREFHILIFKSTTHPCQWNLQKKKKNGAPFPSIMIGIFKRTAHSYER